MKLELAKYVCCLPLFGAITTVPAQTVWNYFISDAGGGNSLVTWNVTGSLATSPGAVLLASETSLAITVNAPGIYADAYSADGTSQALATPDGSYYQLGGSEVYAGIFLYETGNAAGGGNDSFGLAAPLVSHTGPGMEFLYDPGTQSVLIPVAFSEFNPGSYQSSESGFDTPLTVNLTVEPAPEPSPATLTALGILGGWLMVRRRRFLAFHLD